MSDIVKFDNNTYQWQIIDGQRCLVPYTEPNPFDGMKRGDKYRYVNGCIYTVVNFRDIKPDLWAFMETINGHIPWDVKAESLDGLKVKMLEYMKTTGLEKNIKDWIKLP